MSGPPELELFCACAPGLEPLLLAEVRALGLQGTQVPGGVELKGTLQTAAKLNLWLRTATRVLVRLARFTATSFGELEKKSKVIPFTRVLRPGAPVSWRVTCKKSRLYHSGAVAERLHTALEKALGKPAKVHKPSEDDALDPVQQLLVRFEHDACTVSADTSGALLHLRGGRAHVSKAPLRETLAAALLLHAGHRDGPVLDPLCGAGTLVLEAAAIAQNRAPGLSRTFALLDWPSFPKGAWDELRAIARKQERPLQSEASAPGGTSRGTAGGTPSGTAGGTPSGTAGGQSMPRFEGSDLDPKAIEAAQANAKSTLTAGVHFTRRALADLPKSDAPGLVVANPPYGQRVAAQGDSGDPRRLISDLKRLVAERRPNQRLALLAPPDLIGRVSGPVLRTQNGGLPVVLALV